jgi:hypothetical protein
MRRHLALLAPMIVLPLGATCTAPGQEGQAYAARALPSSAEAKLLDFLVNGKPLISGAHAQAGAIN